MAFDQQHADGAPARIAAAARRMVDAEVADCPTDPLGWRSAQQHDRMVFLCMDTAAELLDGPHERLADLIRAVRAADRATRPGRADYDDAEDKLEAMRRAFEALETDLESDLYAHDPEGKT